MLRFLALETGSMFSCVYRQFFFFPRFRPVAYFPALASSSTFSRAFNRPVGGCMFSGIFRQFFVFPRFLDRWYVILRLPPVLRFPALLTERLAVACLPAVSASWAQFSVLPRFFRPVACFPAFAASSMFYGALDWSYVFSRLSPVVAVGNLRSWRLSVWS